MNKKKPFLSSAIFLVSFTVALILLGGIAFAFSLTLVSSNSAGNPVQSWYEPAAADPSISADGRYVAFDSYGNNLDPAANGNHQQIFVKDASTGQVRVVSTDVSGNVGNDVSMTPSISADGRYLAFVSKATGFAARDQYHSSDIFLKDTATGAVTNLSYGLASAADVYVDASQPSISADGRHVAFSLNLSYLSAGGSWSYQSEVYAVDADTNVASLVYSDTNGQKASISGDGRYVAYRQTYTPAVSQSYTSGTTQLSIFVKDMSTGASTLVSSAPDGTDADGDSWQPFISQNGRYVAFVSGSSNLAPGQTYLTCSVCGIPPGEQAGSLVPVPSIYVKDMLTGAVTRASTDQDGNAWDGRSDNPSISADGSRVTYLLAPTTGHYTCCGETWSLYFGTAQAMVKDLGDGQSVLASASADAYANPGDQDSYGPVISASGQKMAFWTYSGNLALGAEPNTANVYALDLADCGASCQPALGLSLGGGQWASYADYQARLLTVDYQITNSGSDGAWFTSLAGVTATNGVVCQTAFPQTVGDLAGGASAGFSLKYYIPAGVSTFHSTVFGTAEDGSGNVYSYPGPFPG